ncbi:MAG: Rho termination factor N-terminal domain-containing protein, partial [Polaribacter sp.]
MFEISELKAKTLAELQVIAKSIGLTKTSQLKKLDLVYQILDTQAANPTATKVIAEQSDNGLIKTEKPRRKRVLKKNILEEPKKEASINENLKQVQEPQRKAPIKKEEKAVVTIEKVIDIVDNKEQKPVHHPKKPQKKVPVVKESKVVLKREDIADKQEQIPVNQKNKQPQKNSKEQNNAPQNNQNKNKQQNKNTNQNRDKN